MCLCDFRLHARILCPYPASSSRLLSRILCDCFFAGSGPGDHPESTCHPSIILPPPSPSPHPLLIAPPNALIPFPPYISSPPPPPSYILRPPPLTCHVITQAS